MTTFVLELLKLAAVGIVSGLFASVLANRDHRSKRWWEMRVSAYQNAIESLSDLAHFFTQHFAAEISGLALSSEERDGLAVVWNEAFHKVRRLADSGAFLFSERANAALCQFVRSARVSSDIDELNKSVALAEKCLGELIECSKVDLKLRVGFLERFE